MYESQNPFIARAMEFLEIASRYVILNFLWLLSIFPVAAVFFLDIAVCIWAGRISLGTDLHTHRFSISCNWRIVLRHQSNGTWP